MVVVAHQGPHIAAAERGVRLAHGDQLLVEGQHVVAGDLVPLHGPTVVGVLGALHAELVAVVDHRGAGVDHLEEDRFLGAGGVAAGLGHEAGHVVAAEDVEHGLGHFLAVVGAQAREAAVHLVDGDLLVGEEVEHGLEEEVVHDRVEHVALQPVLTVRPDLADDVGVGVDPADLLAPGAPEIVVGDLVGDVEAPAVDALLGPVLGDLVEVLLNLRVVRGAQLRQRSEAPPGVVVRLGVVDDREAPEGVEVPVLALRAVLHGVLEEDVLVAGVVEDAVEDHLDAVAAQVGDHALELGVRAEGRVDRHVVDRVVLVVRVAVEDGVEVDRVDPEVLHVGDLLAHAGEVAAHVVVELGLGAPGLDALRIVPLVAVHEALGEDLVEDGVLDPLGREAAALEGRGLAAQALGAERGGVHATAGQHDRSGDGGGESGANLDHRSPGSFYINPDGGVNRPLISTLPEFNIECKGKPEA